MEYCKHCGEKRSIIEITKGMETCPHSPNGRHYFISKDYKRTTQSYDAGYAFGEYLADRLGVWFRKFFSKPKSKIGIICRVAVVLFILILFIL